MSFYDAIRIGASGASRDLEIQRSLRFNDGDSPYLTRTPSSAGNRKTFTLSVWIKRSHFGTDQAIIDAQNSSGNQSTIRFSSEGGSDNKINVFYYDGSSFVYRVHTNAEFRDPTAWYHFVIAFDTTQATASNRIKIYQNGDQLTDFGSSSYPSQNYDTPFNNTILHTIGRNGTASNYIDGYMAEVNFVDGLQLEPSSFGKTDAVTGQWIPQKYSGAYGTNGFRLTFADNSATTATTLGKDESGNGNNFTPNNFSVAASLTNDSMPDTPSNNFCTLNPLCATSSMNFGNLDGNLVFDQTSNDQAITGTFFISPQTGGKWYWEFYKNAGHNPEIGICGPQTRLSQQSTGFIDERLAFISNGGNLRTGSSSTTSITGGSAQTGAGWLRIACDMDNKKIWFSDTSGNYFNSGNPATGANPAYDFSSHAVADGWAPYICMTTANDGNGYFNFGQFDLNSFSSNIPTGFKTLSSENLPEPAVKISNEHFDTLLWTGNASYPRTITGLKFKPDWFWTKSRSNAFGHPIFDSVRGTGSSKAIRADSSAEEGSADVEPYADISSFNFTSGTDGGVTIAQPSSTDVVNGSGLTTVGWNWNAGETDSATYRVVVVSDSGNKYRFRNSANTATFAQSAVTLDLAEGGTYIFNMDDSTNASHPFSIGTAANGTVYTSGITYFLDGVSKTYSEYTSGFASATTRRLHITVPASAPVLYYWCSAHSGMGGQINTNSTLGSSNFDGTIQTKAKANTTAGFSIVTWTGNGSSGATLGHGIGAAPAAIITKQLNSSGSWATFHHGLGTGTELYLDLTQAATNSNFWQTSPTSTVFTVSSSDYVNENSSTYVGYCFSEVEGFSKFGFYKGNNNANGTFIFTGFRPAWVMIKNRHRTSEWYILDNKRDPYNPAGQYLSSSAPDAEATYIFYDFLANGFKLRNTGNAQNANGENIVFFAFAEAPFKYSRAR